MIRYLVKGVEVSYEEYNKYKDKYLVMEPE